MCIAPRKDIALIFLTCLSFPGIVFPKESESNGISLKLLDSGHDATCLKYVVPCGTFCMAQFPVCYFERSVPCWRHLELHKLFTPVQFCFQPPVSQSSLPLGRQRAILTLECVLESRSNAQSF